MGEEFIRNGVSSTAGIGDLLTRMTEHMNGPEKDPSKEEAAEAAPATAPSDDSEKTSAPSKSYGASTDWTALSVRELKDAVSFAGLEAKAIGLTEKSEFISLLADHYTPLQSPAQAEHVPSTSVGSDVEERQGDDDID
jgi:hypothetical protein